MFVTRLLFGLMLTVFVSLALSWAAGASGGTASEFSPIEPGSYRMAVGETEFSLDLEAAYWLISDASPDTVVFTDPGPSGPIGRDVTLAAPRRLASPSADTARGDWSLQDIRGWLSQLSDQVIAGEPVETTLGGRPAVQFDIRLSGQFSETGLNFLTTMGAASLRLESGRDYRVWWVDGASQTPLVVVVSNSTEEHPIVPQAENLLAGLVFDSVVGD